MARGDLIRARLEARIDASLQSLTVNFPPARVAVQGVAPAAAPLSPLTGVKPVPTLVQAPTVPAKAAVAMNCLWIDADTVTLMEGKARKVEQAGWVSGSTALATVKVSDATLNPNAPSRDTIFDDADYVEHNGQQYRVLKVSPVGPGFTQPLAYAVWLAGAAKQ